MSKFTPGPWNVDVVEKHLFGIEQASGMWVAEAYVKADARLIAAAPDLLAALKITAAMLEELGFEQLGVETARAAIARATGGNDE